MHTEPSGVTASCAGSFRELVPVSYQKTNSGRVLVLQPARGMPVAERAPQRRYEKTNRNASYPDPSEPRRFTGCGSNANALLDAIRRNYVSSYRGRTQSRYATRYNRNSQYPNDAYRVNANGNYVYDANGNYVYDDPYYGQNRSVWEEHRDKITTAGGAVGGAVLGGLIGGKKGAVIGAIAGGAGAAIYTYKIRDKNYRY